MGFSIKTLGCSPAMCRSCYESRIRQKRKDVDYNVDAIIETLRRGHERESDSSPPCLHGGEPLLMKDEDLEKILFEIHKLWGSSVIQTNGVLISTKHIELFRKYKTSVGISLDGDTTELNRGRWNAREMSDERIQEETDKVLYSMKRMREAGISLSVIALLRRYNATADKLDDFIRFLYRLRDEFGIRCLRTNEAIVYEEEWRDEEELTPLELGSAFCRLADVALSDPNLEWLPYMDIVDLLLGHYNGTCTFTQCDVWKTTSEKAIDKDGNLTNCLKGGAAIDGLQVLANDQLSTERYQVLSQVPQDLGGCKDCKYWFLCFGGCPGDGIDNDWRNKMRGCEAYKMLFSHVEKKIKSLIPNAYLVPDFFPQRPTAEQVLESFRRSAWHLSTRKSLGEIKDMSGEKKENSTCQDNEHGDISHGNSNHGDRNHQNAPHQDGAHGDSHGDSPHGDSFLERK